MSPNTNNHTLKAEKPRIRAAKACRRCSQRKIKCDAVQNGLPCSRCRMDNTDDCMLILSRRGTYDRNAARDLRLKHRVSANPAPPRSQQARANVDTAATTSCNEAGNAQPPPEPPIDLLLNASLSPVHSETSPVSVAASSTGSTGRSISAMFEDFLNWRDKNGDERLGLILLGEPSPLTFALEELPHGLHSQLHDATSQIRNSTNLEVIQKDIHPAHLDAADIAYLETKGVFTPPSDKTLDDLFDAYLTHFHPLYSIVNKLELAKVHRERKLPWILLHAVCFIGATFCEPYIIHSARFSSRIDARRHFYQKAKLLFDTSYETSKIILLQVAIMLSFWGPQMQSYWNPASWIGFGVTFAVSLGLHRSSPSSNAPGGDTGLLRRLWWTLVVRDTYCAVLLGRAFRIDLPHADTDMLTPDDFVYESRDQGFYQIQIARLSRIIRGIAHCRFGGHDHRLNRETVHAQIDRWRSNLDASLRDWPSTSPPPLMCTTALEILYYYSLVLLHIDKPGPHAQHEAFFQQDQLGPDIELRPARKALVESTSRNIASKAISLITKTRLFHLPHELFPGFFVAGIVLYRQTHHEDQMVAQMAHASLDNCRMVLNDASEFWEPGRWALEIFDFLSSSREGENAQGVTKHLLPPVMHAEHATRVENCQNEGHSRLDIHAASSPLPDHQHDDPGLASNYLFAPSNWDTIMRGELANSTDDSLLMPSFLPSVVDEWSCYQA
ncbi:fungal-specific transcription factor domain-containing protein [Aspergillus tetrazonus]